MNTNTPKDPQTWGIIGLGWLGEALRQDLLKKGAQAWGTHSADFKWQTDVFPKTPCDVLFLNTPPLPEMSPQSFVDKIPFTKNQKVIFVSSISVYGAVHGSVTEATKPKAVTTSGQWLIDVETLLLEKFGLAVTILRPGGLIGGDRHPAISLSKRNGSCESEALVNLIHREDLINIIWSVSQITTPPHQIVNAVTPYHPTKKDYYSAWTTKLGLPGLRYEKSLEPVKIVSSDFLPTLYPTWLHPHLDAL